LLTLAASVEQGNVQTTALRFVTSRPKGSAGRLAYESKGKPRRTLFCAAIGKNEQGISASGGFVFLFN